MQDHAGSNARLTDGLGEGCVSLSRGVVKVTMKPLTSNSGFADFSLVAQGALGGGRFRLRNITGKVSVEGSGTQMLFYF